MLALSTIMLFSATTVAYAAYDANYNSTTIYSKSYNMSLYGYIDFLEGTLWIKDKYYYRGVLSGSDVVYFPAKNANIYIMILDDEGDTAKTVKLYNGYRSVTSSVSYGYFSKFGELRMQCYDTYTSIKAYGD